MNRTGLFGGTFDPVHTGHLIIAQAVLECQELDTIIFIPSARPPHKQSDVMFPPEKRRSMLSRAIEGNPRFKVSDIELNRKGPSYTIDTIREIKSTMDSDADLLFIVGRDNLTEISNWKEPQALVEECRIIVAERPCGESETVPDWLAGKVEFLNTPLIDISSSDIRSRIRAGKSIRYLVPDAVLEMIEE